MISEACCLLEHDIIEGSTFLWWTSESDGRPVVFQPFELLPFLFWEDGLQTLSMIPF